MAFTLRLYSFNKRPNSTKQPTDAGTSFQVTLLDDTSLMNPTFKLSIATNPVSYNYAFCYEFDRYYFITDIVSSQGFWFITCQCDVLASWKTDIGTGSHYVLRSASDSDGYIVDDFYPAKGNQYSTIYTAPNPLNWSLGHSYVLGIIGYAPNDYQQIGSITYYHMDEDAMQAFIYFLMHDITAWSDIATADYDPAVQEALLNPMNYIVSCMVLPVSPPSTGTVNTIYFGYYDWDISTGHVSVLSPGSSSTETTTITKADHPQAAARGVYMNGQPFTYLTAHIGPFGDIDLDPSMCLEATGLVFKLKYDLIQGLGRLVIYPEYSSGPATSKIMYIGTQQIGVTINLSQVLTNPLDYAENANGTILSTFGNLIGLASGTFTGFTGALSSINTGIINASRLKLPTVSGKGTTGSFLTFFDNDYSWYLKESYFMAVDDNNAEQGRPLCEVRQINTLSGYILCQNADCQISGTSEEAEQINTYMNSGFFYE